MFRYTRLLNGHDTIRFGLESAEISVGATYYGHQNWTSDNKNHGDGIRIRSGPMSQTMNTVIAYLITLQDMAHGTYFPTAKEDQRQLLTSIPLYTWRVAIFRVPLSTLQRRKEDRVMDAIDVAAKCRNLFHTSFWTQRDRSG